MLEILKFVFQDFTHFIGFWFLLITITVNFRPVTIRLIERLIKKEKVEV